MDEIGRKRSKSVENGRSRSKCVENGGNQSKTVEIGRKWLMVTWIVVAEFSDRQTWPPNLVASFSDRHRMRLSVFYIAVGCDCRIWSKLLVEGQADMRRKLKRSKTYQILSNAIRSQTVTSNVQDKRHFMDEKNAELQKQNCSCAILFMSK
uniref:Uncharacterized protein n=1 Tax=Tanacetum cinerariifolium TaxID=118510 RepID=A0A6L2MN79_TANCI|nr:hypothetical protein [Tanacetum cinerariifolium]